MTETVIVLGAGQAAAQLALSLRQGGFRGRVAVYGDEADPPYQRPPLSKAYLRGEMPASRLALRAPTLYARQEIEIVPGARATKIDRVARKVFFDGRADESYNTLALCLGSRPRPIPIPCACPDALLYLRSRADADALRDRIAPARDVVILGAGYLGLEIAASLVDRVASVVVLEVATSVLARVAGRTIAAHFEAVHRRHGVGIRLGVSAMRIAAGADGRAVVHASDGTAHPADIVVAAIGGVANDQIARDAGLDCDGGILIDARGLTSDERIVAAGDCAVMRPAAGARALRIESVGNAIEQAKAAAATLCGREYAADPLAWFWSDQFDLKLQTVGIPDRTAAEIVVGDLAADRFAVCYVRDGRLVAVDAVNLPECLIEAKRLIRSSEPFDETNMRNVAAGAAARAPATGSGR